jgi:hypothetical protein
VLLGACISTPLPNRHLLIVIDGLRPDYVTADVMPNLTALGKRGVVFNRHHSVYPTVTHGHTHFNRHVHPREVAVALSLRTGQIVN